MDMLTLIARCLTMEAKESMSRSCSVVDATDHDGSARRAVDLFNTKAIVNSSPERACAIQH
jgi:hypothetical protein